jgi:RNA polymerase sigma-70 factor (ECF subfamily)
VFFLGLFGADSPNNSEPPRVDSESTEGVEAYDDSPEDPDRARDHAFIVRFLGGDAKGFEELMLHYRDWAYRHALGVTGNHDDAMDAVQKAFIRVHRSLHKFQLDKPFFPWLYRILHNTALNQRRNEKRHKGEVPLEWVHRADGRPDPLQATMTADLRNRIWNAIQEMPPEMANVFRLYHFEGHKYREIARITGIPLGTVMSRLHAARLRLRDALGLEEEQ